MDEQVPTITLDQPGIYQIKVQGRLRAGWSHWFSDLEIATEKSADGRTVTRLTGTVADQAALHGLIGRIRDLGLPLLLVALLEPLEGGR